ncbi:hypothetical protein GCM10007063_20850 [Lentibacillus kapialis]|uniref:Uncharacterized protein n=1 Tax=Lentibacillus kapialis TaxID=340214 RepID=A0A917PXE2_9BACI|nr:hypothetical protein [Lentibacillus kapialis]GGJ98364.1 hypothetical protein GCM10007063_20850 [Lentibacillus kapialis]
MIDKWTIHGLLDELDIIELLEAPEYGQVLGEMTKKQKDIYHALGVKPPSL